MAQVGTQNAQAPEVKQFAQQMQTDHKQMDQQLTQAAQTMGVTLEGKDFQKHQQDAQKDAQKLQSKTGKDFDKEFMSRMVKDHEKAAKDVKDAASDAQKGKHAELASMLGQAETQIKGHLDQAKQVQKSLEQSGKQAGSSTSPGSTGTGSSSSGTGSSSTSSGSRGDTGGPPPAGGSTSKERARRAAARRAPRATPGKSTTK